MSPRPIEGLVLSGGASYGAYEVGVVLALLSGRSPSSGYRPVRPSILTGTSAGAFNAAILASTPSADLLAAARRLEQIWVARIARQVGRQGTGVYKLRLDPSLFDPATVARQPIRTLIEVSQDAAFLTRDFLQRALYFVSSDDPVARRLADLVELDVFISTEPLRQLIRASIPFANIRRSSVRLRIAATNWRTGEARIFSNPEFSDEAGDLPLMAAAAVPGIVPPVLIGGEYFVDGGIFMDTPLKPAIDGSADILHVIWVEPEISEIPLNRFQSSIDAALRTRNISNAANISSDLATAKQINTSLTLMEKIARGKGANTSDIHDFSTTASKIHERLLSGRRYRPLTIHCYHPREIVGGSYGIVNFDLSAIRQIIERGYADARRHDCIASQCILPTSS